MSQTASPQNIGKTIQDLRKQSGMNQQALAEKAGLSQAQISTMEQGRTNPNLDTLNRVATALNVPTWVLLAGLAALAFIAISEISKAAKES